jgi:hypothetical protein
LRLFFAPTPTSAADATVLGNGTFPAFHPFIEGTPHNHSHVYLGGNSGDMSFIPTAAQDPFFFLLHTNVDRLWAQWQRNSASLARLDPTTTYDTETSNVNITTVMEPWDGTGTAIQPWTTAGGYIVSKLPTDPSVVSPPIYDTAPLTIPVLQPNEAVVIQIPWYPPNPADFACFGPDQGHVCLVARIETSTTAPFGMTTPETADINANTKTNNNIAWKNVTVVDNFPGAGKAAPILIRNPFKEPVAAGLRFAEVRGAGDSFFKEGRVFVDLKPELFKRWREGQGYSRGVEVVDEKTGRIQLATPDTWLQNIRLEPGETFSVDVGFELAKDYPLRRGPFPTLDLIQTGAPGKPDAVVGGQRFALDLSQLVLVEAGSPWRYRVGPYPGEAWTAIDYDDSSWKLGKAELGFGGQPVTVVDAGPPGRRSITTYFRRAFEVADPGFYRSLLLRLKRADGAIVYLNGKEIHRVNLPPAGAGRNAPATRAVKGLEGATFFPIAVAPDRLSRGKNVLAVEVHLRSPKTDDLRFDLELSANRVSGVPPEVAFASPPAGAMFETHEVVPVEVEALAPDGTDPVGLSLRRRQARGNGREAALHLSVGSRLKRGAPAPRRGGGRRSAGGDGPSRGERGGERATGRDARPAGGGRRLPGRRGGLLHRSGLGPPRCEGEECRVLDQGSRLLPLEGAAGRHRHQGAVCDVHPRARAGSLYAVGGGGRRSRQHQPVAPRARDGRPAGQALNGLDRLEDQEAVHLRGAISVRP